MGFQLLFIYQTSTFHYFAFYTFLCIFYLCFCYFYVSVVFYLCFSYFRCNCLRHLHSELFSRKFFVLFCFVFVSREDLLFSHFETDCLNKRQFIYFRYNSIEKYFYIFLFDNSTKEFNYIGKFSFCWTMKKRNNSTNSFLHEFFFKRRSGSTVFLQWI